MSKAKKNKKNCPYLLVDQIVFRPKGWDQMTQDYFIDRFIELVEEVGAQTGGIFAPKTEKEMDEEEV